MSTPPSDLVVLGGAGGTGRRVVAEALRAGHRVTATTRDPAKVRALNLDADLPPDGTARLTITAADVRDPDSLTRAIQGHDTVVSAIGPPGRHAHGIYSAGAHATIRAMNATGAKRLIAISSAGVRYDDPELAAWYRYLVRPLLGELYTDMRAMENIITASNLNWTLVRPVLLLDRDPTDHYRVHDATTPPRGRTISRGDLARFIVETLHQRQWTHRTPTLAH